MLDPLGSYHRKAAIVRNLRTYATNVVWQIGMLTRLPELMLPLMMHQTFANGWENTRGRSSGDELGAEYAVDRVLPLNVKALPKKTAMTAAFTC